MLKVTGFVLDLCESCLHVLSREEKLNLPMLVQCCELHHVDYNPTPTVHVQLVSPSHCRNCLEAPPPPVADETAILDG